MLSDMSIKTGVEMKYLLNTIPEVQIVKFENFKMESFNKIEDALYNKEIGTLKRDLRSEWSLSANMAYDYSTRNMLDCSSWVIRVKVIRLWVMRLLLGYFIVRRTYICSC